jgi:hypothetical protein
VHALALRFLITANDLSLKALACPKLQFERQSGFWRWGTEIEDDAGGRLARAARDVESGDVWLRRNPLLTAKNPIGSDRQNFRPRNQLPDRMLRAVHFNRQNLLIRFAYR